MKSALALRLVIVPVFLVSLMIFACQQEEKNTNSLKLVKEELIMTNPPHSECHASTIVELEDGGFLAAWFGGSYEKHPDVEIWLSKYNRNGWSVPKVVADGIENDSLRYPCWNPVLFKTGPGEVTLFYKVGPSPQEWWGAKKISKDGGENWSEEILLPEGILGPIKNKPVRLANGDVLSPSSIEFPGPTWYVRMERSADLQSWSSVSISEDGPIDAIQPSVLIHKDGKLQILCRTRQDFLGESWSEDGGNSWSPMALTTLPNPSAGTDAVTLQNGTHLLVYNPQAKKDAKTKHGRERLVVASSRDGKNWEEVYSLEDHEYGRYSYPAIIQSSDELIHITYTHDRKNVKNVVLEMP